MPTKSQKNSYQAAGRSKSSTVKSGSKSGSKISKGKSALNRGAKRGR